MVVHSAGVLLVRGHAPAREVLIGHMGGPFWARKNEGAWTIPKGEYDPAEESAWDAARREFREELGLRVPEGPTIELGVFRVTSAKLLTVFQVTADLEIDEAVFGTFELEWPPKSGRTETFPELDRIAWVAQARAAELMVAGQRPILNPR